MKTSIGGRHAEIFSCHLQVQKLRRAALMSMNRLDPGRAIMDGLDPVLTCRFVMQKFLRDSLSRLVVQSSVKTRSLSQGADQRGDAVPKPTQRNITTTTTSTSQSEETYMKPDTPAGAFQAGVLVSPGAHKDDGGEEVECGLDLLG